MYYILAFDVKTVKAGKQTTNVRALLFKEDLSINNDKYTLVSTHTDSNEAFSELAYIIKNCYTY